MRILHCCLAAFYIDNYSYQENIFPRIHKQLGHEVEILASTETYLNNINIGYLKPNIYFTKDCIKVTRVSYSGIFPLKIANKLRIYTGVYEYLNLFKPEFIYLHDCQFYNVYHIVKYAKLNNVKIVVDIHTDLINSGRNWVSLNILHKLIYKMYINYIEKYVIVFYATLPLRKNFLIDIYGVNENKIKILPFGTDDTLFNKQDVKAIRDNFRKKLKIKDSDFLLVSGGKIDKRKNILNLIRAFTEIKTVSGFDDIKLLIFGKPTPDLKDEFSVLIDNTEILYLDWVESEQLHKVFIASDLAIFPGTHSVLWEDAIGIGLPCLFLKWDGIDHLDKGGNCKYLNNTSIEEIKDNILILVNDRASYIEMQKKATILGPKFFSYSKIAEDALKV
jgi:glycosyltransferase involved in cell wall biosynthesis